MKNIIISDFDLTLSKKTIIHSYLMFLLNLKYKSTKDRLLKYIKILSLPFVATASGIIYLVSGGEKSLEFMNKCLFFRVKKTDSDDTINKIKEYIEENLNDKVLESINTYSNTNSNTNSTNKYIITGNFEDLVKASLKEYGFKVYGSELEIDPYTKRFTGSTEFVCLGKNKSIILDQILSEIDRDQINKKQINLIVYGDSLNDYHMFKKADIRYVVGSDSKLIDALNKENLKFTQII